MHPTKAARTTDISTPSDREIRIARAFDAPRRLVWDAYTKPELLQRWMGVMPGWSWVECRIDLRVGGDYRYAWRGPEDVAMGISGKYLDVVVQRRLVATEKFDQAWYDGECLETVTFDEAADRTTVTTLLRYDSQAIRDEVLKGPATNGMAAGFEQLDSLLSTLTL